MSPASGSMKRLAFLGTGLMGAPMRPRLLGGGFAVTVWARDVVKAATLVDEAATQAPTPSEAVTGSDIISTMLSNSPAVAAVLFE